MMYIPGFSNYLETSVPRYANGGAVMSDPRRAAVEPMTQEAVPFDLSSLGGLNFSGFGGGRMGGVIQDPNIQYITAPVSNKGNPTGRMGGNVFAVTPDQTVRLVDHRTNQVVFEGSGVDAARKATEIGQSLTDSGGRKANYSIQTADPTGNYSTVAYEKKNKSTLGQIANVAGTLLPLALIPLTAGASAGSLLASTAGKIGLGTALGAAGAGLKGNNILKGAVMGGLSSAGGALLGGPIGNIGASNIGLRAGTAIGTGLGATAGGLATGQSLKNSLLGGVASGAISYLSPDIVKGLGINQGAPVSTGGDINADLVPNALKGLNFGPLTSASIPAGVGGGTSASIPAGVGGDIRVIGRGLTPSFTTSNINLGGFKTPAQKYLDDPAANSDEDIIKVTSRRTDLGAVTGGFTGNPAVDRLLLPEMAELSDEDIIKVTGRRTDLGAVTGGVNLGPLTTTAPAVLPNDIVVDATKIERPTPVGVSVVPPAGPVAELLPPMEPDPELTDKDGKKLGLEEYLRLAGLAAGLIGGGGGGGGQTSRYGGAGGTGRLNPIFSAKLPAAGGLGNIGMNRTQRQLGDVDYLTYGTRPELRFFDYAQPTPAPITTPVPNNPAGPAMYVPDDMRFAEGGAFAAKGGGSPKRTEFAVNGPGTGRSDDIPAVLSDGEYVIDAETVALLGDGSSKAGAKKLDELRIKVRKHKGQKLAKGRFSANAKKPEAYLSGGRI